MKDGISQSSGKNSGGKNRDDEKDAVLEKCQELTNSV